MGLLTDEIINNSNSNSRWDPRTVPMGLIIINNCGWDN